MKYTVFTDGSSRGNPGPGGWGTVIVAEKKVIELGGREESTTNNRMELMAAIEALKNIPKDSEVDLYTDSSYLINGITKWVNGWKRNGWMTKLKEEVLNKDLWESLVKAKDGKQIQWRYLGGHSGIIGNERCDEIATSFADETMINLYKGNLEGYPIKNILDLSFDENKVTKKSQSKAQAYSYISMVDGEIKIHKTWAECEARVKGKSNTRFRKSISKENEEQIIREFKKF
jgi:ribonuclease HI